METPDYWRPQDSETTNSQGQEQVWKEASLDLKHKLSAVGGRAREVGLPKPFGVQKIMNETQTMDMGLFYTVKILLLL